MGQIFGCEFQNIMIRKGFNVNVFIVLIKSGFHYMLDGVSDL